MFTKLAFTLFKFDEYASGKSYNLKAGDINIRYVSWNFSNIFTIFDISILNIKIFKNNFFFLYTPSEVTFEGVQ